MTNAIFNPARALQHIPLLAGLTLEFLFCIIIMCNVLNVTISHIEAEQVILLRQPVVAVLSSNRISLPLKWLGAGHCFCESGVVQTSLYATTSYCDCVTNKV